KWLQGQCRSYEQSWPYSMWIDLFERWLGVQDVSPQEAAGRLRQECGRLWATEAGDCYPYLAALLSLYYVLSVGIIVWRGLVELRRQEARG
ncbi:MAG: hypothetical protein ACK2UU_09655, partial [Anaerolineae bacterium]